MGTVITFADVRRDRRDSHRSDAQGKLATIVILPVIRINRYSDGPTDGMCAGPSSGRVRASGSPEQQPSQRLRPAESGAESLPPGPAASRPTTSEAPFCSQPDVAGPKPKKLGPDGKRKPK